MTRNSRLKHLTTLRGLPVALVAAVALATVGVGMIARQAGAIVVADAYQSVNCSTLGIGLLAGLVPSDVHEYSSTLDREGGTITIEIYGTTDKTVTVSYTDPVCLANPVIGPIMARHLEDARVDQLTECADLAQRVASGTVVVRDRVLSIDKVTAYMDQWC